jgi:hypothetical protein
LVFRESANERREARLMVFIVKPSLMPSPERRFHWEFKEVAARASLETYTTDDLSVVCAWLVLEKK